MEDFDDLEQLRTDIIEFFPEGDALKLWLKWLKASKLARMTPTSRHSRGHRTAGTRAL
jgi:hypothetical protein